MDAIEKLDFVLKYLNNDKTTPEKFHRISDALKECGYEFQAKELDQILDKLIKDGNCLFSKGVITKELTHPQESDLKKDRDYYISFEGKLFIETGGYRQKQEDINSHRVHQESVIKKNEKRDFLLTAGAVGATIGTFLLLAWELVKFYLEHHCICPL